MLEQCAPGNARVLKTHHDWIGYKGKMYRSLPKGAHGRTDPEIKAPFVKKLVSQLEINLECEKKHFRFITEIVSLQCAILCGKSLLNTEATRGARGR